jgi:hypothetical protein
MDVKIHLHCFSYGRQPVKELEALCEKVYYYPRKTGLISGFSLLPYNVKSRQSAEMEANLLTNDFPVLFEVLHTCYLLNDARFKNRIKIYRHSNIEHEYYLHLAEAEKNPIKKIYLRIEARKLKQFEAIIAKADCILAVNENDASYFRKKYPAAKTTYLPSFHQNNEVNIKPGKGNFILYHGNLSVSENYEAAEWLLKNVFSRVKFKVIIAGLNPPAFLKDSVSKYAHVQLIANPDEKQMNDLIGSAQVHCLHTAQPTGLKLKLLNVLFSGRFVVCNAHMLSGTGLAQNEGMQVTEDFVNEIDSCFEKEFDQTQLEERKKMLERFSNQLNALKLIETVF